MKKLIVSCVFLFVARNLLAQEKVVRTIRRDTINLRGFIYNADGKPAKDKFIESKQLDLKYNMFNIGAQTDSNGYFMLNGGKYNDTLTIREFTGPLFFYNSGSRFMVIYLPITKPNELNSQSPVIVKAQRKFPKAVTSFKIIEYMYTDTEGYIEKLPEPPGGTNSFFIFIQRNVKYPEKAILHNIEGTVEMGFSVSKDGSITDIKILKGIGYGCDEQVLEAVKKFPKWRPRIHLGRPVTAKESVSVKFSLTDN